MDHTSLDSGSVPVLGFMNQEVEINTLSIPGSMPVSERDSTNDLNTMNHELKINIASAASEPDLNTMSQEHQINIPSRSASESGITDIQEDHIKNVNLASFSLAREASRDEYMNDCLPLYEAAITGDWKAAKVILDKRPEMVRFAITEFNDTALHVAASGEKTKLIESFLENLVNRMEKVDLEIRNVDSDTALCVAAATGSAKMAMIMVNKHKALLNIPGKYEMLPLSASALHGNHEMVEYLYDASEKMTGEFWTDQYRNWVLCNCVRAGIFDIAKKILIDRPELATYKFNCWFVYDALARNPSALNRKKGDIISRILYPIFGLMHLKMGPPDKGYEALSLLKTMLGISTKVPQVDIGDIHREDGMDRSAVLFVAAEMGNTRFVIELIQAYPDLLWKVNDDGLNIFHIAIMHRHEEIYNLLYEIGRRNLDLITQTDKSDNNILHLVGMTSNKMQFQNLSGTSIQMQRELLWFKEVEKMLPPIMRDMKNKDGRTPYELFSENNQDLVSHGLKWMKDCMVVATLIVTVAFAVGFTVPGGYNQETGIPVFIGGSSFFVFVIADAIALFSSTTSLLVFLSILTSHYRQRDFLYALPKKLMIGLVTLFISVASMMITFSASFFVLYRNGLKWVPILIGIFAALPVIIFAALQFPLLVDMFRSMYDSRYLFKPKKRMLYNPNPTF